MSDRLGLRVSLACPSCDFRIEKPDTRYCSRCGHDLARPIARDSFDGLIGQTVDGRYRVVERIGAGGMGVVYRVEHVCMGKIAAMKVLRRDLADDGQAARRFRREVETVSALDHPNIVQTFDFGEWRGLLYLVMEYLRGEDLAAILKREGPMPLARALPLFTQVCAALEEAHYHDIIHRDLKPDNIVCLKRRGHGESVKVLDFGLAKLMTRSSLAEVTGAGSLVGTPHYMAPEQVRGEPADARTDIYSLGATLYRVVTGTPVFQGESPMAILVRHVNDPPEPPSRRAPALGLPREVDELVLRALAKPREDRFATAAEMKEVIEHVLVEVLHILPEPRRTTSLGHDRPHRSNERELRLSRSADDEGAASWPKASNAEAQVVDAFSQTEIAPATTGPREGRQVLSATSGAPPGAGDNSRTAVVLGPDASTSAHVASAVLPGIGALGDAQSEVGDQLRREDVDAFECELRRRRRRGVMLAVLLFAAIVTGGTWVWRRSASRAHAIEREPNDSAATANLLWAGAPIYGHIGEPKPDGAPDLDFFLIPAYTGALSAGSSPRERVVRLTLSAVADLDLVLELFDHTGKPLLRSDAGKHGESEVLGPVRIGPGEHYVRVRTVWVEGQPHALSRSPYALVASWARSFSGWEVEPNDNAESAHDLQLGGIIRGYLHGPDDEDHFRVRGTPAAKVWVTLTEGPGPMLLVFPGGRSSPIQISGAEVQEPLELAIGADGTLSIVVAEWKSPRKKDESRRDRTLPYQLVVEAAR